MNALQLLQLKTMWGGFTSRHPKLPKFLKAMQKNGIREGTVLELQVTTPDGETFASNLKVTAEDMEMLRQMQEMR